MAFTSDKTYWNLQYEKYLFFNKSFMAKCYANSHIKIYLGNDLNKPRFNEI